MVYRRGGDQHLRCVVDYYPASLRGQLQAVYESDADALEERCGSVNLQRGLDRQARHEGAKPAAASLPRGLTTTPVPCEHYSW
jgi:hypothetical protein